MSEAETKKKLPIPAIIAGAVVIIAGIVVAIILANKNKTEDYRQIKVYDVIGNAQITRTGLGELSPYINMMLESGDNADTYTDSYMQLKLDEDKYVLMEPDTQISLEATGNSEDSNTSINLLKGGIVNDIENPLSENSSYQVNTPNSTMMCRGTTYRVYVYKDEEGESHSILQVCEGTVTVQLINPDGTTSNEEVAIPAGNTVAIGNDETESFFESITEVVNYEELNLETLEFLNVCLQEYGADLTIEQPALQEIIEQKKAEQKEEEPEVDESVYTVTFTIDGNTFGTQEVKSGELASRPVLNPSDKGSWSFDFTTPITEDTTIEWK